jgi:hypothetical protein
MPPLLRRLDPQEKRRFALRSILLLGLVFAVYSPALRGAYVWDDHGHVPDRAGLYTLSGLSRIWSQPGFTQQYYPLTFTTVWLAHHVWGNNPIGYHLLTVLFHAMNALLLFLLLDGLKCPGSWWGAFLFALHPVEVESVAWISEIKNTQSTFFYLLALFLYLRAVSDGLWKIYLAAFGIYLCALTTKTATCTLPAVAFVLVWYRNGRVTRKECGQIGVFLGVGILMALMTAGFERNILGAVGPAWELTVIERISIAGRAFWFYLGKLFWPYPIIFNYPHWDIRQLGLLDTVRVLAVPIFFGWLWRRRHRWGNGPFVALAVFGLSLSPALGFVSFYPMRYSFVADHFQYLASMSVLALCAAGLWRFFHASPHRYLPLVAFGFLCAVSGAMTWHAAHAYQSPEILYKDILSKNPDSTLALENLVLTLIGNDRMPEARTYIHHLEQIPLPDINDQVVLGHLQIICDGNYKQAIPSFERAAREINRFPVLHSTQMMTYYIHAVLAEAYYQTRRYAEAKAELQRLLAILPSLTAKTYYDTTPEALIAASERVYDRLATIQALEGKRS